MKFSNTIQHAAVATAIFYGCALCGEVPGASIQARIDAAAASGGGVVSVEPGWHEVGQLDLKSGVELHLEKGAVLAGTTDRTAYSKFTRPYSEGDWMGIIIATNAHDVAVTGPGTIFGNGCSWADLATHEAGSEGLRPRGLVFADCRNVRLEDFKLIDAPSWGIVFKKVDGVTARRVSIDTHSSSNNDGFDIEAKNVLIEDCDIDSSDDAIVLKSNSPDYTVENVVVRRCVSRSTGNAFKIGTATHGVVRNILFEDSRGEMARRSHIDLKKGREWWSHWRINWLNVSKTIAGLNGFTAQCVDGGIVEDVTIRRCTLNGYCVPIFIRGGERLSRIWNIPPNNKWILRNILIEDVTGSAESSVASSITGAGRCRPQNVTLRNVKIVCKGAGDLYVPQDVPEAKGSYPSSVIFAKGLPAWGLYVRHADGVRLENVEFELVGDDKREKIVSEDATLTHAADVRHDVMSPASACVVELAALFTDGCVLQRGVSVPVWGRAEAGEKVNVSFGGQCAEATADANGRWMVRLAPMKACAEGRVLAANGHEVKDVLVGEVWLCAGQSNAEMPLCGGSPRYRDRTGALVAAMTRKPLVRFVSMSGEPWSAQPRSLPTKHVEWKLFAPESLNGSFSAMGAYFAMELHSALGVPVGVIGAYQGSTPIESWIPPAAFESRVELKNYPAYPPVPSGEWTDSMKNAFVRYGGFQQPCVMWNARVAPLVPYALKGVIWYQGCSNQWNPDHYLELQHALYDSWAETFGNRNLAFRFVQVDAWEGKTLPIQLAQAQFAKEEKNAAMAVISDIGNRWDAHPNEKGLVAKRLAALALARDYGFADIRADSPTLREWRAEGREAVLTFDNARSLYLYNPDKSLDSTFELAGPDGKWVRAEIVNVEKNGGRRGSFPTNEIRLAAPGVASPTAVRYLHCAPFTGNIFNEMNLPLGVFRADK